MLIQGEEFYIKKVDASDLDSILQVYMQCEDFLSLGPITTASEKMVLDDLELSKKEGGVIKRPYLCVLYLATKK